MLDLENTCKENNGFTVLQSQPLGADLYKLCIAKFSSQLAKVVYLFVNKVFVHVLCKC